MSQPVRTMFGSIGLLSVAAIALTGCAAPAVNARLSDDEIRATLAERIPAGVGINDVQHRLDDLGVSNKYRVDYAATTARPRVLLARVFGPGGFWIRSDDNDVEWVDISFVFSPPPERLEKTLLFRDKLRYWHRDPITAPHSPKRALQARPGRFPLLIPPPVDPVEGAQ